MKKHLRDKKTIILIIISIMLLSVISIVGYRYYQQQEVQKKIDVLTLQLENKENDFNEEDTREDKVSILKSVLEEHTDYEKSKDMIEEIDEKYHSIISNTQNKLKEEYDKILIENTLKDIDKIDDKSQLENSKKSLNDLLSLIKTEENIVSTKSEVEKYDKDINSLIKSYDERLNEIEEAERKAAEEEAKKQQQNNYVGESGNSGSNYNYNNGSSSSSNGENSGSNYNYSTGNKYDGWYHGWNTNLETGEKIPGSDYWQDPNTGNQYDKDGNQVGGIW
ncbi:MAG: hypothetical protein KHY88_10930 [Erysipelotrichaceae bacterium]|nr:hypothetical protein [Erysipelotrichaceae bacterium]